MPTHRPFDDSRAPGWQPYRWGLRLDPSDACYQSREGYWPTSSCWPQSWARPHDVEVRLQDVQQTLPGEWAQRFRQSANLENEVNFIKCKCKLFINFRDQREKITFSFSIWSSLISIVSFVFVFSKFEARVRSCSAISSSSLIRTVNLRLGKRKLIHIYDISS